ncbi:Swt1 family HEPN domain-containing protein [Streptosporangium sp. NBC_01639]|uniref:Swt1 family HEPN domain-containing protein n=1 Tax=Streptosporangium sp. NBC_01639 TaxID=2975948 RepID=UPI0038699905|nr:Swt1 family HEPN domain-containing protein [Streptosporangium sp. NBC_01639]
MAPTSNKARVQQGFDLLAEALEPFIDEVMSAAAQPPGADWMKLLEAQDAAEFGTNHVYAKNDPQVQLHMITEEWRAGFKDRLSRADQSIASLLRDQRNRLAHNQAFSAEDTTHVLDLIERLLTAVNDVERAAVVRKLRRDHDRAQYEAETRKAVKDTHAFPGVAAELAGRTLKPWRQVIQPHEDVRTGKFVMAKFAADLYEVAEGTGDDDYSNPIAFFQRTYLTVGLKDLLINAAKRFAGDSSAEPVINLQTNFGGGKTHSMLALHHLASGHPLADFPQEVQDLLSEIELPPQPIKRVALVGTEISAKTGVSYHDEQGSVRVRTLWGQLAWQLGGRAAYEQVRLDDEAGTNPGAKLRELISEHAPCLILIDEWVAYARELFAKDDLDGGTFETQFGFAQALTAAVKSVPGAILVISIPASEDLAHKEIEEDDQGVNDTEVGGLHGRQALIRLQRIVGRTDYNWQPASSDETFEIVRRRLFEEPDAQSRADISVIARAFVDYYRANGGEFPRDCSEVAYERRISACYPIHPELFDRLYKDWSALDRFQLTRGVLRVMSRVVHALWSKPNDADPLIMPGSLPLDVASVSAEITGYLGDPSWRMIVKTDVDGDTSVPVQIDEMRSTFGGRSLTRRLARTIFFGSAPSAPAERTRGIERQYVWLGTAVPGDTLGNFGSALDLLAQRATYFYPESGSYRYNTAPSITKKAQDHAERLRNEPEVVWEELVKRLKVQEATPSPIRLQAAPLDSNAVPDYEEVRLILLHPRYAHGQRESDSAAQQFVAECLRQRGSAQRVNVNQLLFLAPDKKRLAELDDAVRYYLAWKDVVARKGPEELNLNPQQANMAEAQCKDFNHIVDLRVSAAYIWVLYPKQQEANRPYKVDASTKAEGSEPNLGKRVYEVLRRKDELLDQGRYGSYPVRMHLDGPLRTVWEKGHVETRTLWDFYRKYPYLDRLRDRSVLEAALQSAMDQVLWETQAFALADGYDEASRLYVGLAIPPGDTFGIPTDSTLIVRPDVAEKQRRRERELADLERDRDRATPENETGDTPSGESSGTSGDKQDGAEEQPEPEPEVKVVQNYRFFGKFPVDPSRASRDFGKVAQEVLQHLQSLPGAALTIKVEIEATHPEGYPDDKVRTVTENARTLKFEDYGFENE